MPTPPRATRRTALVGTIGTALGGTLATLALSGCDTDDLRPHDADPTITPSASAGARTPDETLVDEVTTATAGAVGVIRQARAFPALRPVLGSLLRAHRAHLEALATKPSQSPSQSPSASSSQPGRAESAAAALTLVRATEQALQTQLVAAAGRAESGTLAALLASMSASVAQHLAALPAEPA